MPYVFKAVLDDGEEEAIVYDQGTYNALIAERDQAIEQRDGLADKLGEVTQELKKSKAKYAAAFLDGGTKPYMPEKKGDRPSLPQTFDALFN